MMRTHTCGELRGPDIGREVVLCGWVRFRRDHGGVRFIDLADRYGWTQIVASPGSRCFGTMESLGREWVVRVRGKVRDRTEGTEDGRAPTGNLEVLAEDIEVLNKSLLPPFEIAEQREGQLANEDQRLEYRYLDLRRPRLIRHLELREDVKTAVRSTLLARKFWELETPTLVRSTPEGARDFLVPSRLEPGKFYALPQSPQIYKQLMMVAGLDRYFQITRCYRDEDLRADRQPEFTQVDVEMSFADEEDIMAVAEEVVRDAFREALHVEIELPFPRLAYADAMEMYGSDKPDTRFDMRLVDVTEAVRGSSYEVFAKLLKRGGRVVAFAAPKAQSYRDAECGECGGAVRGLKCEKCGAESKPLFRAKTAARLIESAQAKGAKGMTWLLVKDTGIESVPESIAKAFPLDTQGALVEALSAEPGDIVFLFADEARAAREVAGQMRLEIADWMGLRRPGDFRFLWVTRFPLVDEAGEALRHPFTAPEVRDDAVLRQVRTRSYDLVLNGVELGSGSIRIHDADTQVAVLERLGYGKEEIEDRFGFLIRALRHGAPPHGGIALGLDRLVAMMCGTDSIRDVIPFPKTKKGQNPMDGSPAGVDKKQLDDLQLHVARAKGEEEARPTPARRKEKRR
jgi:aspartyl-tRNA synthetase